MEAHQRIQYLEFRVPWLRMCVRREICVSKGSWKYCFISVVSEFSGLMKDSAESPAKRLGRNLSIKEFLVTCYRMP